MGRSGEVYTKHGNTKFYLLGQHHFIFYVGLVFMKFCFNTFPRNVVFFTIMQPAYITCKMGNIFTFSLNLVFHTWSLCIKICCNFQKNVIPVKHFYFHDMHSLKTYLHECMLNVCTFNLTFLASYYKKYMRISS